MEDIEIFCKKKRNPNKKIQPIDKAEKNKEKNQNAWNNLVDFTKELKNEKFELYYSKQLSKYFPNKEQWEQFLSKLKEKLPCVFRVNKAHFFHADFLKILTSPNLISNLIENSNNIGIKIQLKDLTCFPEWKGLVYNINLPRMELKKNETFTHFHKFIQKCVDSGIISRQEAVSMIPPMLMQVKPTDTIFDMCAAPGSKTAQFLEVFYENFNFLDKQSIKKDTGFVLANDNNQQRAYMMVHQLKRLNTAGMVVIAHDAQFFPTLYDIDDKEKRILFDKILADVPCSSDAVMRKLPHKWKNWSTKDSYSLHKIQLKILKRGVNLLKVGGTIIYSTCSLNPIEDEAVVAEIMRSQGKNGELEIVDMTNAFNETDIKPHRGLTSWSVYVEDKTDKSKLIQIKDKEDKMYKEYKDIIDESCFSVSEDEGKRMKLDNCIRLFPHDSDTSGFFITLIKKVAPLSCGNDKQSKNEKISEKGYEFLKEKYPNELKWIVDYYGIDSSFPVEQLVTQSSSAKKINFVSKGVERLLRSDNRNQLKLQNAGVKMFKRNKARKEDEEDYCFYRICQDGMMYVLAYMHKKVHFVQRELFIEILKKKDIKHEDIKDERVKKELSMAKQGCIVVVNMKNIPESKDVTNEFLHENFIDAICCYNAKTRITTMINKEHQHVFNLKYKLDANIK